MTATTWASETTGAGNYADVNGLHLYYETHGSGRPMILLHGGLGSGEMFGPILPQLSADHQVIAPFPQITFRSTRQSRDRPSKFGSRVTGSSW